jgi:hypothetical protein
VRFAAPLDASGLIGDRLIPRFGTSLSLVEPAPRGLTDLSLAIGLLHLSGGKIMALLSRTEVKSLLDHNSHPCVSLFLPTHRVGTQTQPDRIRFKNLLHQAEKHLSGNGLRHPEVKVILEPALQLHEDRLFWQHQSDGLAVFLSPGLFQGDGIRHFRLPLALDELVLVGPRFHIKPLLPLLTGDGRFYLLALGQNSVRLLEGTRHTVQELQPERLPRNLAEALQEELPQKQIQFHTIPQVGTGGKQAALFHGHGAGDEDAKNRIQRYFRRIEAALHPLLQAEAVPLVLAGVEYLFPIYREVNRYPYLLEEGIAGNPEALRSDELHRKAWPLLEPLFRKGQDRSLAQYQQFTGTGRTSSNLEEIMSSAQQGRVDSLFVPLATHCWGRVDAETGVVERHDPPLAGDQDLLDLAAALTFSQGGTIYAVPPSSMPNGEMLAAVYRY